MKQFSKKRKNERADAMWTAPLQLPLYICSARLKSENSTDRPTSIPSSSRQRIAYTNGLEDTAITITIKAATIQYVTLCFEASEHKINLETTPVHYAA